MPGVPDPLYVQARRLLLDALEVLAPHRDAFVLVGAQAVYVHVGDAEFAVAPSTKDGDIAIDPALLDEAPELEAMMLRAGFTHGKQPGIWERDHGSVDLLVPDAVGGAGRRGARLAGHESSAARKVVGIEGALIDHEPQMVESLDHADPRRIEIKVAGPAALLVAKAHKLLDRIDDVARLFDKDALDAYRLLVEVEVSALVRGFAKMFADHRSAAVARAGVTMLRDLFGAPDAQGIVMIARSLEIVGEPEVAAAAAVSLTGDLLAGIRDEFGEVEAS